MDVRAVTADGPSVARLLRALLPEAGDVRVTALTPLYGGFSAETLRVQAEVERGDGAEALDVVVRRTPAEGLLAPYDVERECRILRALADSEVPVAAVVGCDPSGEHLGAPCLVTRYVPGEPLSFFGQYTAPDDGRLRSYFATLAAIHAVDWRGRGLGFLDTGGDALEPELARSGARLALNGGAGALEREMLAWLRACRPALMEKRLLHGDPNPANYLFQGSRTAAVLDWELATAGDPRIDVGFYAAIQAVFGAAYLLDPGTVAAGYAAARGGGELIDMAYFEAVGLYRVAGFVRAAEYRRGLIPAVMRDRIEARFREIVGGTRD